LSIAIKDPLSDERAWAAGEADDGGEGEGELKAIALLDWIISRLKLHEESSLC